MKWVLLLSVLVLPVASAGESAVDDVLVKTIPGYLKKQDDYRTAEKRFSLLQRKLVEKQKRIQANNPGVKVQVSDNGEVARARTELMSILETQPKTPISNEELKRLLDEIKPASYVSSQIYGGDLVIKLTHKGGEYEKRIPKSNYTSAQIWNSTVPTLDIESLSTDLDQALFMHINTETKEADFRVYRASRADLSPQKLIGATSSFRVGTAGDVNAHLTNTHFAKVLEAYKKSHRVRMIAGESERASEVTK